ncbi:XRE family transcriptional regulator [Pseudomonas typographi]|uniref:XRE family transcriptional regulator n=1 Tax=Pseudomonas typographi TaxID=2715964 RepID=UPI00168938B7|nr:XRE family transcriptional regulator [Pseudomonas typographi]MBD1554782.1 XRE family transcriptional regulator [Pseudomonas typographi]
MKTISKYTPPSTQDLESLKHSLGFTGNQMAQLVGIAEGRQWRKYTGGSAPRELSAQLLFMLAARLALDEDQLDAVYSKMRAIGAEVDLEESLTIKSPLV